MKLINLIVLAIFSVVSASVLADGLAADTSFWQYLLAAWSELGLVSKVVGVLWALVPIASLIVSLTPTPKDDAVFGKYVYPLLEKMALVFFKAKDKASVSMFSTGKRKS